MKNQLLKTAILNSLAVAIYIFLVAVLMTNGNQLFGQVTGILGGVSMLLLFTLSALVVGSLVLGKPIMLYLDGSKKEAVKLLMYIISFLALITIIFFAVLALKY